ncbi:MAG: DUF1642 domain-containing protein [Lactococcus cremoris]
MSEFEKELLNKVSTHDRTPPKPQQSLPVVPEDVDKAIKYLKTQNNFATLSDLKKLDILTEKGFLWLNDFQFKDRRFGFGGLNNKLFILSHLAITGYTVEKEKLYYLREKNTGYYLTKKGDTLKLVVNPYFDETNEFSQSEIDELNIGSYEKLEVES